MIATKAETTKLLQPHQLPEGCRLARMRAAVERAREAFGEKNRRANELRGQHEEVTRWLARADADNAQPLEFATRSAEAILLERSLERQKDIVRRATEELEVAGERFRSTYDEYSRLVREFIALDHGSNVEREYHDPHMGVAAKKRLAAARARLASDEGRARAAEIETIRARIRELTEPD